MMDLEWAYASRSIVNGNLIKKLKEYREIIIFGAGDSGSWAYGLLIKNGLKIKAFCDNCENRWGEISTGGYMYCFYVGGRDMESNKGLQS